MDIFRTELKKVKKLGAAKSGTHHWWHQRLTAIILSIFAIWLVLFIKNTINQDLTSFIVFMQKPYNIAPIAIITITAFYHGMLGMQVIIEDYVACEMTRLTIIVITKIFSLVTVACFLTALFYMMIF